MLIAITTTVYKNKDLAYFFSDSLCAERQISFIERQTFLISITLM